MHVHRHIQRHLPPSPPSSPPSPSSIFTSISSASSPSPRRHLLHIRGASSRFLPNVSPIQNHAKPHTIKTAPTLSDFSQSLLLHLPYFILVYFYVFYAYASYL
ncbi:hypothetical protein PHYSODRAFT_290447 [Phytophthora sojae]|uniref:Uncharacterized protein n=1 Tax=Phytophthora sojae (strain P6497) TaxID=1094619 RepID=G5AHW4_PHYSP|nr:hypothetical protein PHYSODRAFT_290373 [Phytophthora sojae]XP_009539705.1 hypothetical protein PHYSODRAFT_290447 [Phytophthora sojae]EGZ04860.1 hypothetical protein PHYSODRAFT_290373 [Phytophthora sojae]EGZ04863.1 hypothetical protein PHYSODRAFT_290447 [Phytophthora sojae]|eukprot:XP_009539702.1 hypothetical protein PHYSODRAFT_290373 [Phytophthora sojae]